MRASFGFLLARIRRIDLVQIVHRDDKPFQYMRAVERLIEVVLRAAGDDVLLMLDKIADHGLQAELTRLAVGDADHVHAEGDLQIGVFIQIGQHLVGIDVAL